MFTTVRREQRTSVITAENAASEIGALRLNEAGIDPPVVGSAREQPLATSIIWAWMSDKPAEWATWLWTTADMTLALSISCVVVVSVSVVCLYACLGFVFRQGEKESGSAGKTMEMRVDMLIAEFVQKAPKSKPCAGSSEISSTN